MSPALPCVSSSTGSLTQGDVNPPLPWQREGFASALQQPAGIVGTVSY